MDITADGEWLLVVDHSSFFYIYNYDHEENGFLLFQTLRINSNTNRAGAITDDHQWLILTKNNGKVYVYAFNGTKFTHKETINYDFPNYITSVSITNDHMYLAFMIASSNAYVYEYNGTNFTLYQNITMNYDAVGWRYIQITNDHQHLVVAGGNANFMRVYQHDGFKFIQLANTLYSSYVGCASFSKDKKYLAVTTNNLLSTRIYKNATM